MHVDGDLAKLAVRILAGPEIDLATADTGLPRIALSSSGKRVVHDETREARDGGFVGENGVRLARLFARQNKAEPGRIAASRRAGVRRLASASQAFGMIRSTGWPS